MSGLGFRVLGLCAELFTGLPGLYLGVGVHVAALFLMSPSWPPIPLEVRVTHVLRAKALAW